MLIELLLIALLSTKPFRFKALIIPKYYINATGIKLILLIFDRVSISSSNLKQFDNIFLTKNNPELQHTHPHTHRHIHILSHTHTLTQTCTYPHTHTLTLHTHSHPQTHTHTQCTCTHHAPHRVPIPG